MKTTKKHFEIFKKECEKWIKEFGLHGWKFWFDHGASDEYAACCLYPELPEDRQFTLVLALDLPKAQASVRSIKGLAFHEVMEAFLYKMTFLARERYIQEEEVGYEKHRIIRTLEKVVFDGSFK